MNHLHHLQLFGHSKKGEREARIVGMMDPKQKQRRKQPKLERRNAIKNIDYEAFTSASSSEDHSSGLRTRSLDIPAYTDRTSFRIEGVEGELDRIYQSLGLSGPDDFAIPAAAWEARKARSSSDLLPRSRLRQLDSLIKPEEPPEVDDEVEDGLAARFSANLRFKDEVADRGGFTPSDDSKNNRNSLAVGSSSGGGGGGIKGIRPPVLAPPPFMSPRVIDDMHSASTWDIMKSFAPQDDDRGSSSSIRAEASLSGEEDVVSDEEGEKADEAIVRREEVNVMRLGETAALSESCSFTTSNDDDSSSTTTEPMNISPNGRFRRNITSWQRGDFLGSGTFGTVFEGFTDDGFFFAVKEVSLLDQGSQGKQSISQLEQEIALLSQFEHENIVRYLGTDKDEAKLYIFLELVTKGSLASLYQKYDLRDSQVSAYTRQILNGLMYLHARNVVHRDIKCANILVDASGSVKLADFGLAKATKLNDVKSCKGTAFWMAPEVVNRKKHGYGLAADIWSLGCTVLEMLTRQVPYSDLESMQALFRIGRGIPPLVPDSLSRDARDFILQCLQVNPEDRPKAAQLLDHPFMKRPLPASSIPASPSHHDGRQS